MIEHCRYQAATLLQDEPCAPLTFRRGALLQLCWGAWRNSSAGKLLWTLRSVFRAHEAQSIVRTTLSAWKHECRTCQSLLRDEQSKVKFVRLCLAAAFFGWQLVSSASSFLRKVVQATADARCQAASVEVLSVVVKEWGVLTKEVRATPTQIKKAMLQQPDLFAILEAWKMLCAGSFASCSASCALLAFHKSSTFDDQMFKGYILAGKVQEVDHTGASFLQLASCESCWSASLRQACNSRALDTRARES
eukprot:g11675.t1